MPRSTVDVAAASPPASLSSRSALTHHGRGVCPSESLIDVWYGAFLSSASPPPSVSTADRPSPGSVAPRPPMLESTHRRGDGLLGATSASTFSWPAIGWGGEALDPCTYDIGWTLVWTWKARYW